MSAVVNNGPAYNAAPPDVDEDELDIGDLIGVLVENRWLIVAITAVAVLLGFFRAYTAVPIYQADSLIQIEQNPTSGALPTLEIAMMMQDYALVQAEIEILKSRNVLGDVVDNLKLDIHAAPEYMPIIGGALARRLPANERPSINVDTLEVPESLRGNRYKLVATGGDAYELYGSDDEFLLRGSVGTAAGVSIGGEYLSLFVSETSVPSPDDVFLASAFAENKQHSCVIGCP